jgi:hypothetical protein
MIYYVRKILCYLNIYGILLYSSPVVPHIYNLDDDDYLIMYVN